MIKLWIFKKGICFTEKMIFHIVIVDISWDQCEFWNFACENLRPASICGVFKRERSLPIDLHYTEDIVFFSVTLYQCRSPNIPCNATHIRHCERLDYFVKDERIPTFGQANNRYLPTMNGFLLRFTGAQIIVSILNATSAVDDGVVKGSPCCSAIYVTSSTLIFSYSSSLLDSVVFSKEMLLTHYW